MKKIALGADHGGFALKEAVKKHLDELGIAYEDFGTYSEESVDYPDMAVPPCEAVVNGECDKALLFCGTGVGISIAATKVKGIRACCCSDTFSAKYTQRALHGRPRGGRRPCVRAGGHFPEHGIRRRPPRKTHCQNCRN